MRIGRAAAVFAAAALLAGCTERPAGPAQSPRCAALQQRYGLTPCPADPIPVEPVTVQNLDKNLPDAEAHRIAQAYLRSRALYYLAIQDNSDRFFESGAIDLPGVTPLMFEAETGHIRDARARHGSVVLASRSTLKSLRIVPLPQDLRDSLEVSPAPMADAVVIEADGPEQQLIRVPGRADQPVSTLERGDSYRLLVGGVLVTKEGLPETFAELGQWECLDPDTHDACQLPPAGAG
ncbi:MAG: hypothetical protein AUI10_05125 [Actinobacteria bacterium 13_2_20CM_2_72_6]|nr:MAG: hypothetical protein AUI10_05125 [Actinobacteria bacterium 13_2_20CM_2_72_6]